MPIARRLLDVCSSERTRLLFACLAVFLVTGGYAMWLNEGVGPASTGFLYTPTGQNNFWDSLHGPRADVLLPIFVFSFVSVVVFALIRFGTNSVLALVGSLLFMTTAQVGLVFMSSPFWDFANYSPVLIGLFFALMMISIPSWVPRVGDGAIWLMVVTSVACLVLALGLSGRIPTLLPHLPGRAGVVTFGVMLLGFCAVSWVFHNRIRLPFELRLPSTELLAMSALTVGIGAVIVALPVVSRTGSSSVLPIFLILSLAPLFYRHRRGSLPCWVATIILLATTAVCGGASPAGGLTFYVTAGWQDAPQLAAGVTGNAVSIGVPFSDGMIGAFLSLQSDRPIDYLTSMIPVFLPTVLSYASIAWNLLSQGVWSYPEPPIGVSGWFWQVRGVLVACLAPLGLIASLAAPAILLRRRRSMGVFLAIMLATMISLVSISRPQGHQWWFLPIFGIWALAYVSRRTVIWLRYEPKGLPRASAYGAILVRMTPRRRWSLQQLAVLGLVVVLSGVLGALGGQVGRYGADGARAIQAKAADTLLEQYTALPWSPISSTTRSTDTGNSTLGASQYALPMKTSLARVKVFGSCSLEGTQLVLKSDAQRTDPQRFFAGVTFSQVAYLPVIAKNGTESHTLFYSNPQQGCTPQVDVASIRRGQAPVLAWIPDYTRTQNSADTSIRSTAASPYLEKRADAGETNSPKLGSLPQSLSQVRAEPTYSTRERTIAKGVRFEGYVDAGFYRAINPDPHKERFLEEELSAQVLGTSDQGYMASDIWVSSPEFSSGERFVRVSGRAQRGSVVVGAAVAQEPGLMGVPLAQYQVYGSIFNQGSVEFNSCFKLLPNVGYRVFVGVVTDRYGYSWADVEIDSIDVVVQPCQDSPGSLRQWLPSLS
jgi:hypothetical protein